MNEYIDRVIARLRMGWCKGHCAENALGNQVCADGISACKWCLYGAMVCEGRKFADNLCKIFQRIVGVTVPTFNDTSKTVDEVIAALERCKE